MNILQQARKRQSMSRPQMADKLGLNTQTVYQYESNRRIIRACDLLKVAKAYSLTNNEILKYLEQVAR
ncbi:helix-turn-helix transcriptional regulator [Paraclostridium sordellii]|uniref:helix-turn-helix transcriptional regulator n=1 Tax=Paraclostridium sordellii TaxID=1505 RepID=UPI0005E4F038|nr:helix-turn-helix transcriptional regulator [Paeniclostridium sordellii]CEN75450.1 transcriptional regulator [[Clostridium] sordellii] [Paeniclostridium sordellii]CEO25193.1 transcriptional regulator [[Clostridium] sordellii] [Paeniclostridium sordellii]